MMQHMWLPATAILLAIHGYSVAAPPRVLDERWRLELVASHPTIVTPVGLTFCRNGGLLVVESHTHQRPEDYDGPASDRIRLITDPDGDDRLDRWTTFADGFRHAMNVLARRDGAVYVVTRNSVELLRDNNRDNVMDERRVVLRLETEVDYPHNALSGIAIMPDGNHLLVGLGENFGDWYRLIGSDGIALEGEGGRGIVFRCTLDGSGLTTYATGFWNPFGICFDPRGRVFVVDNDPDASPPCRLLHVIPGGDYGFVWQYGRAGTHPLQSWNGELPGTLPMVAGTGEAPTAVLFHDGRLWVTSWGEHRIERYELVPRGASFTARREIVVQGDADFRPTGMAVAPDGSMYFGDWMRRDYEVHQQGRIWRLTRRTAGEDDLPSAFEHEPEHEDRDFDIEAALRSADPFEHTAGVWRLSRADNLAAHRGQHAPEPRVRLGWLEAMRRSVATAPHEVLRNALSDEAADVRLYAIRWIADERILELRDAVAELLSAPPPDPRYYLTVLAAVDWLDHEPTMRSRTFADELLVRELRDQRRPPEAQALALRLLSPESKFLTLAQLRRYLAAEYLPLRREAVRSLAMKTDPKRFALLAELAADKQQDERVRLEAIAALGAAADVYHALLEALIDSGNSALQREAERVLRLAGKRPMPQEEKPPADNVGRWVELLQQPGDAEAGRRLFFSGVGPRCGVCHQHNGRGGRIGPDLTQFGSSASRERIITSILRPSQEIAPHYQPWTLITSKGKTFTGLRLPKAGDDGVEEYADAEGKRFSLPSETIELREPADVSIMPEGLEKLISLADLRDLVTFLAENENIAAAAGAADHSKDF